ncbi:hypothetical protein XBFFR1_2040001 [Xenorhabdus bovienii str. feltiae France]|nr:hypothetical protein XBFFR1_2040001 [Xenorhabdus bovienii str. feltiae France]
MHEGTELKLANVAGKTTLSIRDSAIYVNGNKVATDDEVKANYASKIRLRFSRKVNNEKGEYPELNDGEVMTGVRGSSGDVYYESKDIRYSIVQYLVNNKWVTAKNE